MRKLLPLKGQEAKKYKVLVQLGKAICLAFYGAGTCLEEKLTKEKSGAGESSSLPYQTPKNGYKVAPVSVALNLQPPNRFFFLTQS